MTCPAVAFVFLEAVKFTDIFGIAHGFEYAHIFPAGKNVRTFDFHIDPRDTAHNEFSFIQLAGIEFHFERHQKITPDQRLIDDIGMFPCGNFGKIGHFKMLIQKFLAFSFGFGVIIKNMKRIAIGVMGINTVTGKTAAETVGTVMHRGDGTNHRLP